MRAEELEKYRKAGLIAAEIKKLALEIVKPGIKICDAVERLENEILKKGAKLAFPLNLSLNDIAAHDTADLNDTRIINEDVIKVDIGVHIDGYIADTAITICFNDEYKELKEICDIALQKALSKVKAGVAVSEIGAEIEDTIKSIGYKPIENLSGHGLDRYNLHTGLTIPNVTEGGDILREGQVIAIEPFATNGKGRVTDTSEARIFQYSKDIPTRLREAREILRAARDEYKTLPFAARWFKNKFSAFKIKYAINQLLLAGAIFKYPVLREEDGGVVVQAEHTVIVKKDGCEIIT